jgi:hypothetical protein
VCSYKIRRTLTTEIINYKRPNILLALKLQMAPILSKFSRKKWAPDAKLKAMEAV